MPAKRPPRWQQRAATAARAHPWVTWGTLASIATVLGVLGGGGYWLVQQVATPAHVQSLVDGLRSELDGKISTLRRDVEASDKAIIAQIATNQDKNEANAAWLAWGSESTKTLLLRNRLNDCNGSVKPSQRTACEQYESEYKESAERSRDLYNAARRLRRIQ